MPNNQNVVTQLVIDAGPSQQGSAQYIDAMQRAEKATENLTLALQKTQDVMQHHIAVTQNISAANDNALYTQSALMAAIRGVSGMIVSDFAEAGSALLNLAKVATGFGQATVGAGEALAVLGRYGLMAATVAGTATVGYLAFSGSLKTVLSAATPLVSEIESLGSQFLQFARTPAGEATLAVGGIVSALALLHHASNTGESDVRSLSSGTSNWLASLLPIGGALAAAAGAIKIFSSSIENAVTLEQRAQELRLGTTLLQGIQLAAANAGVSASQIENALNKITAVSKKAADDDKDFYTALANIDPALSKAFQSAATQADRLNIVATGLRNAKDEVQRYQLAEEAFGTQNDALIAMFTASANATNTWAAAARGAGLILDDAFIQKAAAAQNQLNGFVDLIKMRAVVAITDLASHVGELRDQFPSLSSAIEEAANSLSSFIDHWNKATTEYAKSHANGNGGWWQNLKDAANADWNAVTSYFSDKGKEAASAYGAGFSRTVQKLHLLISSAPPGSGETSAPAFKPQPELNASNSADAYELAIQRVKSQIDVLNLEAAGAGKTSQAVQELKIEHQLTAAAMKAGEPITDEMRAKWKAYADQIADLTIKINQMKVLQEQTFKTQTMFMSPSELAAAQAAREIDKNNWVAHLNDAGPALAAYNQEMSQARDLTVNFFQSFNNDIINGTVSMNTLSNAVKGLESSLLSILEKNLINQIFGGLGGLGGATAGGGGLLGGLFKFFGFQEGGSFIVPSGPGALALPGFAGGADFTVPGSGAPDSKMTAFRVSPGERVTVTPANKASGGAAIFSPTQNISIYGGSITKEQVAQATAVSNKALYQQIRRDFPKWQAQRNSSVG